MKIMYQMKNTEILFIDDIGAENCSAWSRDEVLGPILQYRMQSHLPTFFTSIANFSKFTLYPPFKYSIACGWSPVGLNSECNLNNLSCPPYIFIK